ncbi:MULTISPECIES: PAS domain-containing sensor histidine kinase [unclassified Brenneria]|uniref:PAS domain-containing sensor histidine kinase n=1 Tax=unclassified Brenneria TaxID=2634434 RepID=UPI0015581EA2|nr:MULTISPECIES: PAS domain S-box protein [unclassified Brenneria]MBJ7220894.1 PAS domain S-box protein [Brenneria sp. L3-3C-1]MEE3642135.1 PAS domain S-box protein [Brenneria sp. L3_3C_1]MEE3650492.1 PAS domain S-box protein [Brenneria sp. HEZEL_4_2_4]NPD00448.1 PAS domain S-box protein [Brenneria sp. hezel4-2-4]
MMFTQPFRADHDTQLPKLELVDFAFSRIKDAIYIVNAEERFCYANEAACQTLGYSITEFMRLSVVDIDPRWPSQNRIPTWWQEYNSDRGITFETQHMTRYGMIIPVEVNLTHFKHKGCSYSMCVVRDIRERKHIEQLAYAREQEFRALVENTPDLIIRFDPQLNCLYANPATLTHLNFTIEQLRGRMMTELMPGAGCAARMEQLVKQVVDTRSSAEGELMEERGKGVQRHQAIQHIRCVPEFDQHGALVSILTVGRDITAIRYAEKKLADSHMQLRLLARQREISREEERKHIAQEIHDELGQHLTTIRMSLSLLRMCFAKNNPDMLEPLQKLMLLSDQTIQVVRNVATQLRPNVLNMGLTPSLEWLCDEFNRNHRTVCLFKCSGPRVVLNDESATAAFRVAQESLTNVARYADATQVVITLKNQPNRVVLRIQDNGKGFDVRINNPNAFGLISMKERGRMLGGDVSIKSTQGKGTVVQLSFPKEAAS